MVEDDDAAIEANAAIRQFEIVDGVSGELRLDKIFEVVAPVAEAAAKRERHVQIIQQFVALHEHVEHMPWIAELLVRAIFGRDLMAPKALNERLSHMCDVILGYVLRS